MTQPPLTPADLDGMSKDDMIRWLKEQPAPVLLAGMLQLGRSRAAAEARATTAEQRLEAVNAAGLAGDYIDALADERDALQAQKDAALALLDQFENLKWTGYAEREQSRLVRAALTDPPKAESGTGGQP